MAVLDMNEELAQELVNEIGGGKTKFFQTNVLKTESIAAAVKGTLEWVKETGKEVGGVIAAAGVGGGAKVSFLFRKVLLLAMDGVKERIEQVLDVIWPVVQYVTSNSTWSEG